MSAAELHYTRPDYAATVSQTTTVTLAGETSDAPLVADMTIEVSCADLGSFLTWSGAYSSTLKDNQLVKAYPQVKLDTPAMAAAAQPIDTEFRDKDADLLTSTGNTAVQTLQGIFKNAAWVYASKVFEDADLPIEAVVAVENGALTATTLAAALGSADESSAESSHPVDLFEQCLAAGKIPAAQLNPADGSGRPTFAPGDSMSLYVTYTITKTRKFELDSVGKDSTASITVGNKTLSAAEEEEADPIVRVVRWKFNQNA